MRNKYIHRYISIGFRIVVAVFTIGLLVSVARDIIVPSGVLTLVTDLRRPAAFISEPKPNTRLENREGEFVSLVGDPLYIDLTPPSSFDTVTVQITYDASDRDNIIEIGALSSALSEIYSMRSAAHPLFSKLNWHTVSQGKLTLYDRKNAYVSVEEFLRNPLEQSEIAQYYADTIVVSPENEVSDLESAKRYEVSLRGSHTFYVQVMSGSGVLDIAFELHDMNRQTGADPAILSLYKGAETTALTRAVLIDDKNTADDQKTIGLQNLNLRKDNLVAGVYRLEFVAPADVFMRSIATPNQKLVIADRVYLGDDVGFRDDIDPLSLYTDGKRLGARTSHISALQTLLVGGRPLEIRETHTRYAIDIKNDEAVIERIDSPKRDIILETDGVFALEQSMYFEPRPRALAWYVTEDILDQVGINAILTTYEPPQIRGNLAIASATFAIDELELTEKGDYRFVISSPGIEEMHKQIEVKEVKFILRRGKTGWLEGIRGFEKDIDTRVLPGGKEAIRSAKTFNERVP